MTFLYRSQNVNFVPFRNRRGCVDWQATSRIRKIATMLLRWGHLEMPIISRTKYYRDFWICCKNIPRLFGCQDVSWLATWRIRKIATILLRCHHLKMPIIWVAEYYRDFWNFMEIIPRLLGCQDVSWLATSRIRKIATILLRCPHLKMPIIWVAK